MPAVHPKTSGAALGGALGLLIVAILGSISGVHLTPEANAAIPVFLGTVGSWLSPSSAAPVPAGGPSVPEAPPPIVPAPLPVPPVPAPAAAPDPAPVPPPPPASPPVS